MAILRFIWSQARSWRKMKSGKRWREWVKNEENMFLLSLMYSRKGEQRRDGGVLKEALRMYSPTTFYANHIFAIWIIWSSSNHFVNNWPRIWILIMGGNLIKREKQMVGHKQLHKPITPPVHIMPIIAAFGLGLASCDSSKPPNNSQH